MSLRARVAIVIALGLMVSWIAVVLGRSPMAWYIP
jgi:hypothetical protein